MLYVHKIFYVRAHFKPLECLIRATQKQQNS